MPINSVTKLPIGVSETSLTPWPLLMLTKLSSRRTLAFTLRVESGIPYFLDILLRAEDRLL
ncbi:MAG: hypothetical protein QXD94_03745 [Sulfolobales archaeon]